jgi:hypothetical protein
LGIVCNMILFVAKIKYLLFLTCPRRYLLCKHSIRFAFVDPRGLDSQFLIQLVLLLTFSLCISYTLFSCRHRYSFRSESLLSNWLMDISDSLRNRFNSMAAIPSE